MVQQQLREHNQKNHIAGLAQDCSNSIDIRYERIHVDGLVHGRHNSIANAPELLQSGAKSSISGMKEFMSMG